MITCNNTPQAMIALERHTIWQEGAAVPVDTLEAQIDAAGTCGPVDR